MNNSLSVGMFYFLNNLWTTANSSAKPQASFVHSHKDNKGVLSCFLHDANGQHQPPGNKKQSAYWCDYTQSAQSYLAVYL